MRSAQHNEVDTEAILTLLQGKDKQVVIPRMEAENSLAHILLTDATWFDPTLGESRAGGRARVPKY